MSSSDYPMPSVGDMIYTHTLAYHIITSHDSATNANGVFDQTRLLELRRFVNDPSKKNELLREYGMEDAIANPEVAANKYGSLTGYIMARHGTEERKDDKTGELVRGYGPTLYQSEIDELKQWFDSGAVKGLEEQK